MIVQKQPKILTRALLEWELSFCSNPVSLKKFQVVSPKGLIRIPMYKLPVEDPSILHSMTASMTAQKMGHGDHIIFFLAERTVD